MDARCDPNGRIRRTAPQTPSGMHPKMSTFCVSPMAPSRRVPINPAMPRPGATGDVDPTPEGCHPVKNCDTVVVHAGKGVN